MSEKVKPPEGLGDGGLRLWASVTGDFDLDEHETALLVETCRTIDLCDELETELQRDGAIVNSPQGRKANPAAVELRQQRIALARLLAALRMPQGDEGDKTQGRREQRPQRRAGARGVYGIRGGRAS